MFINFIFFFNIFLKILFFLEKILYFCTTFYFMYELTLILREKYKKQVT